MDFSFTPEEEAFRQEAREWFRENPPDGWINPIVSLPRDPDEQFEFLRAWHKKLYDGGWVGISWPKEYGGRGGSLIENMIFEEEMVLAQAPPLLGGTGVNLAGPTIMVHGTEEQKQRYLPKILNAEEIWCQGFSEPNAGSDLANLNTRAVLDGDVYVINGQKIWTSRGHRADLCIFLARTDPEAPKHKGITYFLLDMHSPGVTTRPLVQMTGNAEFCEVFLEDVRVSAKNVLGEVNRGWYVAMTTLMFERGQIGGAIAILKERVEHLIALARKTQRHRQRAIEDPIVRQKIAQGFIESELFRLTTYRSLTRVLRGKPPGPEGSILKIFLTHTIIKLSEIAMEIEGPFSVLDRDSHWVIDRGIWQHIFLLSRGYTIAGGTTEINKNVIGERVLGLPR